MRFDDIESFSIDELLLDEDNYRFQQAEDQEDCIDKIYRSNPGNFKRLMTSLAEDDLGEVLLVYRDADEGTLIVLDGNRRTAALKVLDDPNLAPTAPLRKEAERLKAETAFDFEKIHAQVSEDKNLILRTVYERHAAGKGIGQIDWTALANAKFRYDQTMKEESDDWYDTALLMELEKAEPEEMAFVYSGKYSHEVFRRIVRAAVKKGIIPKSLFSDRQMRIKNGQKAKLQNALEVVKEFLAYMESGKINLSRNGDTYADKKKIDDYLMQFEIVEEPEAANDNEDEAEGDGDEESEDDVSEEDDNDQGTGSDGSGDDTGTGGGTGGAGGTRQGGADGSGSDGSDQEDDLDLDLDDDIDEKDPTKIQRSKAVIALLKELKSRKLNSLYRSLVKVPLSTNPAMVTVGAWSFRETISTSLGGTNSFDSFLTSKINNIWFSGMDRDERKKFNLSLKHINEQGNSNKHCSEYFSMDAKPLVLHFEILEPVLIKALEQLVQEKKDKEAAE